MTNMTIPRYGILFCAAFAFFATFAPMGNVPSDTEYSIATARSLVHDGSVAVSPSQRLKDLRMGRSGAYYSIYGIGYALLFTPAIILSDVFAKFSPCNSGYIGRFIISFTNTLFAALILVLFFHLFILSGYSYRVSLAGIAVIGGASILLPYSKIIHSEIPATLLLLLFLKMVMANKVLDGRTGAFLGGIASLLILIKPGNICYASVIGMYGAYLFFRNKYRWTGIITMTVCALVTALGMAVFNFARFGMWFDTGYGAEQQQFSTPFLSGLTGLLFSPSKSIIIFSPLVPLCGAALVRIYRKHRELALALACLTLIPIVFYAKWHGWHGGWAWGPRLVVPSLIVLHLAVAEVIVWCRERKPIRYLFVVSAIAGFLINIPGTLVSYQQMYFFHRDFSSVTSSHPVIASKLLVNKLHNRPEVYSCKEYGLDRKVYDYEKFIHVITRNDSLDFTGLETYQGLNVMWDGIRRNFGLHYLWAIPCGLLLFALFGFYRLWVKKNLDL